MMLNNKKHFIALVILFFCTLALAQKAPMKWGKINDADLQMTSFAADTSAAALVLGNFGELEFDYAGSGIKYRFNHHRRIKLLKRSSFDYADVTIYESGSEKIESIKAQIFLPDGTKVKVDKKDIFEEKVTKGLKAYTFTFPKVQEGAIIEYTYEKISGYLVSLEEWYFQEEIPVRHSEIRTAIPEWYNYVMITQGRAMDVNESERRNKYITIPGVGYTSTGQRKRQGFENISAIVNYHRYAMLDVPALKEERFITTMDDYLAKAQWQLATIHYPYSAVEQVLSTWPAVAKELYEHPFFGEQFLKKKNYKSIVKALEDKVEAGNNQAEKATIIYTTLANEMEWSGSYSFLANDQLKDCYELKKGNSASLNLMLLALLKHWNIEAYPLLLSTRGHGKMQPLYPIMSQFNHVAVLANINNEMMVMDLGSPFRAIGFMREACNNGQAWLADPATQQWVTLQTPGAKQVVSAKLQLDEEGTLTGKIQQLYDGYNGVWARGKIDDDPEGGFLKEELIERYPEVNIENISFKNRENIYKAVSTSMECTIPGGAESVGDFIYLTPDILPAFTENPFKLEERTYPVDIAHGMQHQVVLTVEIPEGYAIDGMPEPMNLATEDRGITYTLSAKQIGKNVQIISKLKIEKLKFEPEEYTGLKNFFNMVLEKQEEPIVLKQKT
ncbi:MAG: DUF3857 domain-containing protein [Bacteroidota bacterium]